jgi:DNA-directed RNA polymerase specialized sigma24 family protein
VDRYPTTQEEWRELRTIVQAFAYRLTGSQADADDLTQEALTRLTTTRRWDPSSEPSLAKHMMKIVKSVRSHERDRESTRGEYEMKATIEQRTTDGASTRSAEQMSVEQGDDERARSGAARRLAALRERLSGFDLELQLIDLTAEGVDRRADQAKRTGRTVGEVYEAWRRIYRYASRMPADTRSPDDEEVA